jgi:hypothetical protein
LASNLSFSGQQTSLARALLLCLLALTIASHLIRLRADPPADLDWSGGYFADEGFWAHNARNEALFQKPLLDDWDARIVSPVFARFQEYVFRLFGVGIVQVRLIGFLSSLLIAFSSFFLLKTQFNALHSFLFSLLISINFPMLILGRQGILDPFATGLTLAAFALLITQKRFPAFLAGIFIVAACITKYLMIYALAPLLFLFMENRRILVPFLSGFLIMATVWLFGNYIPNQALLHAYNNYYSSQQSWDAGSLAKNIITQPFYLYFLKTPALLFFGNLSLWYFLNRRDEAEKVLKLFLVWLVAGSVFFALWRYRPFRYYTSLIPPLGVLAGIALLRIDRICAGFHTGRRRWILWLGVMLPAAEVLFVLCDHVFGWNYIPQEVGVHASSAVIFLVLTALLFFGKPRWMIPAFVLAFVLSDCVEYARWLIKPQYAAVEISRDLQERVGDGILTGQWAPELCLENEIRVVPVWKGFVNDRDPFTRFGITHVLQWDYGIGGEKFADWYPQEFRQFQAVAHYKIKNSNLTLYEKKESP